MNSFILMPAVFNLIETRQISGLGSIKVPSGADPGGARVDVVLFDLIRPATNRFRNFTWFPPRERIANLTFRSEGIVLKQEKVEFERQVFYDYPDPGGQALVAIQCAYKGILQTFFNLGNALALPSISINNDIKDYTRLETPYNEVIVACYADAAVAVSLFQLVYETCGTDSGLPQSLSGLPPAPAQTPPGQPITISPPYDENDPAEPYEPAPIDIPPEPPPPANACQEFSTVIRIDLRTVAGISAFPVTGTYPARVVATDSPTLGQCFLEDSICDGEGNITGLYANSTLINQSSSTSGNPQGRYLSVTCDDPNIPVFFDDFP